MNHLNKQSTDLTESGLRWLNISIGLSIIVALSLKLYLVFHIKIHRDEFFFLSHVHSYFLGSLESQFQNFHVHFFTWLPLISGNEIDQVIAARILMYLLLVGSCIFTYLIGRQYLNRSGALFGLLCYLSLSNLVVHGGSFRADSLCSFLFLFAVYQVIKTNRGRATNLAAGLALAIAMMISIKSAFYLVTIVAIMTAQFFSSSTRAGTPKNAAQIILSFSIAYALLYAEHYFSLDVRPALPAGEFIDKIYSKVIIAPHLFPGLGFFWDSLYRNTLIWIYLLIGTVWLTFIGRAVSKPDHRPILLSFLVPLASLVFYRNSFPYFYVFIISPAIVLSGIILHKVTSDFQEKGAPVFLVFAYIFSFPVFVTFLFHFAGNVTDQTGPQRRLLAAVHEVFPEPVPYIDGYSAISSFPKSGMFMSSWGMENYLAAGRPTFRDLLEKEHPVFLFANIPSLDLSLSRETQLTTLAFPLMEEDWKVLHTNFIHHWGILYVLGKQFEFDAVSDPKNFEILVPGDYTLESDGEVYINGVAYRPGATPYLGQGNHTIRPQRIPMTAKLRWGKNLLRPSTPPPSFPPFQGF